MRPVKAALLATATAAGLLASSGAWADARVGATVGVRGGYATNPYSSGANSTGSGTLTGTFSPTIELASPTGSTSISGDISHTEFTQKHYDGATNYNADLRTAQQIAPTISMTGGAGYSSVFRNALFANLDPNNPPGGPDDPIIVDPSGAATYGQRTKSWYGNLGMTFTLSPRDNLSINGQASQVDFSGSSLGLTQDFDTVSGGFSYMRVLNPTTSLGLGVNMSRSNYHDMRFGDGTQISPTLILDTRFSSRWSLNLNVGLTFSDTKLLIGSAHRTAFSGSATLCNQGSRSNFCLNGSRSVAPTALSGISTVTMIGANYRYRVSARDDVTANVSYSNSKRIYGIFSEDYDYITARVNYGRRLADRLSANVSLTYSDAYSSFINRSANIWGTIGISYRLGDI